MPIPHLYLSICPAGKGGRAQAPPSRDRRRTGCADAGCAGQGVQGGVVKNPLRILSGRYNILIRDINERKNNDFAT